MLQMTRSNPEMPEFTRDLEGLILSQSSGTLHSSKSAVSTLCLDCHTGDVRSPAIVSLKAMPLVGSDHFDKWDFHDAKWFSAMLE